MNFAGKDVEIGLEMGQVNKLDRDRPISRTESWKHGQTNKPDSVSE